MDPSEPTATVRQSGSALPSVAQLASAWIAETAASQRQNIVTVASRARKVNFGLRRFVVASLMGVHSNRVA
jgi:hypothetical protein